MARRKFTLEPHAVVPKAKPGAWGRPRPAKTEIKHEIYGLRGISERGHGKAHARARLRARIGNFRSGSMVLGGRFLRYFTMFLVVLVLFAVVTDASYASYKLAVRGVYNTTETVSSIVTTGLDYILDLINFFSKFVPEPATLYYATRECSLSIKISGDWIEFTGLALYSYGFTEESQNNILAGKVPIRMFWITSTPEGYGKWKKVQLETFFGSQENFICRGGAISTWGIRKCKYTFTSDYMFPEGE